MHKGEQNCQHSTVEMQKPLKIYLLECPSLLFSLQKAQDSALCAHLLDVWQIFWQVGLLLDHQWQQLQKDPWLSPMMKVAENAFRVS